MSEEKSGISDDLRYRCADLYFRGNQKARGLISGVSYKDRRVRSLCIMELVQGCRDRQELREVKMFIRENIVAVIHPDEAISETGLRCSKGMRQQMD